MRSPACPSLLERVRRRGNGAQETLSAGQAIHVFTNEVFVVKSQDSQHPFYVSVYMTGSAYGNGSGQLTTGDPDFERPAGRSVPRPVRLLHGLHVSGYVAHHHPQEPDDGARHKRRHVHGAAWVGGESSFRLPLEGCTFIA